MVACQLEGLVRQVSTEGGACVEGTQSTLFELCLGELGLAESWMACRMI